MGSPLVALPCHAGMTTSPVESKYGGYRAGTITETASNPIVATAFASLRFARIW
jgi:hypothetical protein